MQFKDIIAQDQLKAQLTKSVQENRVSHAQLFLGPEGCGNLAMAIAYAQYINCENRSETDSCGICPSCTKSEKFIHPDIHFTFPFINADKKEKCADWLPEWREFLVNIVYGNYNDWIQQISAENKQGNINAKECMDIIHRLSFKTFEAEYKILILWLPEFLEKEGNRLLKIIEEPPDNTIFLFVANDADKIINTILSRLQLVKFPRLNDYSIAMQIEKNYNLTAQQSKQIAAMSDGNFREAMQLLSFTENENTTTLRSWMEHVYRRNIKELFTWNDVFAKWGRENQKNFFHYCIHFFREVLLLQTGTEELGRLTDNEIKTAEGLSKVLSVEKTIAITNLLDKGIYFVERNANAKILIAYLSSEIMYIVHENNSSFYRKPFFAKWTV
ncbi:MAG: ATP-binding protein [Chitinophagales bacterium]